MPEFPIAQSTVKPDGDWSRFTNVRETAGQGTIEFDPGRKPGAVLCMRLRDDTHPEKAVFTRVVCWGPGEEGRKVLATEVASGTRFTIDAHGEGKGQIHFDGKLFTA